MQSTTPRATEAECQRTVVDAARICGWKVHHNRPALNRRGHWSTPIIGDTGFPDLVLVHPRAGRLWFVELKRRPNKIAPDQAQWGRWLEMAGAEYFVVWVPDELDEFVQHMADASVVPA